MPILCAFAIAGCSAEKTGPTSEKTSAPEIMGTYRLPAAVSNNAAAWIENTGYSFAGLNGGTTWERVSAKSYACDQFERRCREIAPLPDGIGRLAAAAVAAGDKIYIFGGYSVAEDGHEISTPEVWIYDPATDTYGQGADIPVPVDDSVALLYAGRYIYLVSGWSMDTNVDDVQVYDVQTDTWAAATSWPGAPVFGHAGGIVENVMVVCDGVQIVPPKDDNSRRTFEDISACWRGDISNADVTDIEWRRLAQLPGKGHYRMAAAGWPTANMVVFAGGTDNPYNYNGIGYNGEPSAPSAHVWGYDIEADNFVVFEDMSAPSMDHRALLQTSLTSFTIMGGMGPDQILLDDMQVIFPVRK